MWIVQLKIILALAGLLALEPMAQGQQFDKITLTWPSADTSTPAPQTGVYASNNAATNRLLGVDITQDNLLDIDTVGGNGAVVGPVGDRFVGGLAWDPNHEILYGTSTGNHVLVTIDPGSGATVVVGPLGVTFMHGLGYDSTNDVLYGITAFQANPSLYRINVNNGSTTLVGVHGRNGLTGLAFDPVSGTMFASEALDGELYTIDLADGSTTLVGSYLAGSQLVGLGFDPVLGLCASDNKGSSIPDDELYTIDTSTGEATLVGSINHGNVLGLAFEREPVSSVIYCTAKTNSLGCVPVMDSMGAPSPSASSGFVVSATNVHNQKPGLLLYSVAGRDVIPFQGGVLCVAPKVQRTPPRSSGGSHPVIKDCSGAWRIDMNAFAAGAIAGKPDHALSRPGTTVHCQWWGRDPGDAHGSALTGALQYQTAP